MLSWLGRPGHQLGRAVVVPLAVGGGCLVALTPGPTLAATVAASVAVGMLTLGRKAYKFFFVALAVLLGAYAFLNKGAAYAGIAPLYVGEVVLFLAVLVLIIAAPRARLTSIHVLLLAFMALGLLRTVPYIETYGLDALRDAASWGYAIFALAVSLTLEPKHFDVITRWYRRLLPLFVIWVPIAVVALLVAGPLIPKWPGPHGGTTLIFVSHGQFAVHLAAGAAFVLVGLYKTRGDGGWLPEPVFWVIWLADAAYVAAVNRGSMLALSVAALVLLPARSAVHWLTLAAGALIIVLILALANPVVDTGTIRPISFNQLVMNAASIFTSSDNPQLEGTKSWRQEWWNKIIGYTIEGPYFWTGKGFGRNIAVEDGFSDGVLRAPHNSHLEFLARMGVPGLVLWVLLQLAYGIGLLRSVHRARRLGRYRWFQIQTWILVFWAAAMVNMSFDPYLQGPHGGIWFWTMFGLGLAAMRLSRLSPAAAPDSEPDPGLGRGTSLDRAKSGGGTPASAGERFRGPATSPGIVACGRIGPSQRQSSGSQR